MSRRIQISWPIKNSLFLLKDNYNLKEETEELNDFSAIRILSLITAKSVVFLVCFSRKWFMNNCILSRNIFSLGSSATAWSSKLNKWFISFVQRMLASYLENVFNFISVSFQYPGENGHKKLHIVFVHICSNEMWLFISLFLVSIPVSTCEFYDFQQTYRLGLFQYKELWEFCQVLFLEILHSF